MPKMFVMRDYAEYNTEEGRMQCDSTMRLIHESDLMNYIPVVLRDTNVSVSETIKEIDALDVGEVVNRVWLGDYTDIIRVA